MNRGHQEVSSRLSLSGNRSADGNASEDQLFAAARIKHLAPADATRLGIPDAELDMVYSFGVLAHFPEEQLEPLAKETRRVLKPHGLMLTAWDYKTLYPISRGEMTNFLRYWIKLEVHIIRIYNTACGHRSIPSFIRTWGRRSFGRSQVQTRGPTESHRNATRKTFEGLNRRIWRLMPTN